MIGIALLRTLKPPNFVLPLPWEIAPLFDSILKIDMPARAPTDNLLLPLRPMISKKNCNMDATMLERIMVMILLTFFYLE